MNIKHQVSLKDYSTMRLGGTAAHLVEVHTAAALPTIVAWADAHHLPIIMIGEGSNIFWRDEGFPGLVIVNKIPGYHQEVQGDEHLLTIGAGEDWDDVVRRAAADNLTGIEALSLIPGTAGATPIQNVGAYGQEIAQTLVSVTAYDCHTRTTVTIPSAECAFGYRSSRFKTNDRGRFLITAITLKLRRDNPQPPFYGALQDYLAEHPPGGEITPQVIRRAVMAIRGSKLPNPAIIANNGSFFANPIVDKAVLLRLEATYASVPYWPVNDSQVKLSAAWLLERAGFKNVHDPKTGMATWPTQPLVLVNEHAQSTAQLLAFKRGIVQAIETQFNITLQQEPELLPHKA